MASPKARKLPSGKWNVQVTVNGQRMSITRPAKKEAEAEARFRIAEAETGRSEGKNPHEKDTVSALVTRYIRMRQDLLSPSTIQGYRNILRNRFKKYMNRPWCDVNWQIAIKEELSKVSRKTVLNAWFLIKSAAEDVYIDTRNIKFTIPNEQKQEHAFLNIRQMNQFQQEIKGDPLELACLLGFLSLRKSEIEGLKRKDVDLDNHLIHVRRTRLRDYENGGFIERNATKTTDSTRDIPLELNPRISELIASLHYAPDDYLVNATSNGLYKYVNSVCEKLDIPRIGVHGLRHTFASICWEKGIPIEVCMLYGGWTSERTVRTIYQHLDAQKVNAYTLELAKAFQP